MCIFQDFVTVLTRTLCENRFACIFFFFFLERFFFYHSCRPCYFDKTADSERPQQHITPKGIINYRSKRNVCASLVQFMAIHCRREGLQKQNRSVLNTFFI